MIDHLLHFADEATAAASLPSLCTVDPKTSAVTWSPNVLIQTVVMADAVWSAPDPQTGKSTLTTPQQNSPSFFLTISTIAEQPSLAAMATAKPIVMTRDKAAPCVQAQPSDFASEDYAKAIRVEPIWFGTAYPTPDKLQASDFVAVPSGWSAKGVQVQSVTLG